MVKLSHSVTGIMGDVMDLQTLLQAVDQLPSDDLRQLKHHIEEREHQLQQDQLTDRYTELNISALKDAIAEFREGLSEQELSELLAAMSMKIVNPSDLDMYNWLDDLPEDER